MKKKTQYRRTELKEVTILGRKIFFHTGKREVIFPQGMGDIEIEWISDYLVKEGFVPRQEWVTWHGGCGSFFTNLLIFLKQTNFAPEKTPLYKKLVSDLQSLSIKIGP